MNCIIGQSDSGKSAVLRALNWVVTNKPGGEAFRSSWGGRTLVELEFSDGSIVGREKDKENVYYTENQEYKAFGQSVPDDVTEQINMDDINIQAQMDSPFLLSSSSGEVAKTLNRIANFTQIDTGISNIRKKVQENSRSIKTANSVIEDLEKQIKEFDYLEDLEEDLIAFEELSNKVVGVTEEEKELAKILVLIFKDQVDIEEIDKVLKAEPELKAALTLTEQLETTTGQIRSLERLIKCVAEYQQEQKEIEELLLAENDLNNTYALVEQHKEIEKQIKETERIIKVIEHQEWKLHDISVFIDDSADKWHEEFPDVCPLCGVKS